MNKDLKLGDKVMLSPTTTWIVGGESDTMNPLNTEGVVGEAFGEDNYNWVNVTWGNTDEEVPNCYHGDDSDLILVEEK